MCPPEGEIQKDIPSPRLVKRLPAASNGGPVRGQAEVRLRPRRGLAASIRHCGSSLPALPGHRDDQGTAHAPRA